MVRDGREPKAPVAPQEQDSPEGVSLPLPQTEAEVPTSLPLNLQNIALRGVSRRQALNEHELAERERVDNLTGALKEEALKQELFEDIGRNPDTKRGLVFIDLGNFKKANKYTQTDGDDVLKLFTDHFRRAGDIIARSSERGDEFIAVINLVTRDTNLTPEEVLGHAIEDIRSIRTALIAKHPHLDEGTVRLFVGAGGVGYDIAKTYEENRELANAEMIRSKEADHLIYGQYRIED